MKLLCCTALLPLVLSGCAAPNAPEAASDAVPHVGPVEGFQPAENFDPDDVASIRESRDHWVAAFSAGDAEALAFVFQHEAVMAWPEGLPEMTAEDLFASYSAELDLDESSEQYITDGGDPRTMTRLPWVSYYADYTLTLTPTDGGESMESSGRFMTRFHRQPDGSLEVIRGPAVGDPAPLFALNEMRSGEETALVEMIGEKPTVLVFGSYT